jgi:ferredoxin-type protein NapF
VDSKKRIFGRFSPKKNFVYPPYFENIQNFSKCVECEEKSCLVACEEEIIEIEDFHPVIKFGINGCTFCDECANACDVNVLNISFKKNKLNAEFIINIKSCIAWRETICFSCQDICPERCIMFKGMFNPVIDDDKCTACGFCLSVCPANSIEIIPKRV